MMDEEFKAEVLKAALSYAERGWHVVPMWTIGADGKCTCGTACGTDAGKHTWVKWKKAATTDRATIEEWFGATAPPRNMAIVTGAVSGVTVIDIDGVAGAATWQGLIAEHGEPATLMAKTGSGGMHVLFKYNAAFKNKSALYGQDSHIDCRNDKGYIVAAPSRHKSGGTYSWLNDDPLADLPVHLVPQETRGRKPNDDPRHRVYTLEEVRDMLTHVSAEDRDLWRHIGIILGRTFARRDAAWNLYNDWSATYTKDKGRGHDEIMHEAFYEISQKPATGKELSMGTIITLAKANGWTPRQTGADVPPEHIVYLTPHNDFLYLITRERWSGEAVDTRVAKRVLDGRLVSGSAYIEATHFATSVVCDPALAEGLTKGIDYRKGESITTPGSAVFNLYERTGLTPGEASQATLFIDHCTKLFNKPGDCDQFLNYMACIVQRPEQKIRFVLLLCGEQGCGKDTAIDMCCPAIGQWNVASVPPSAFESGFNEHVAATLIRVNEVGDQGHMKRWAFNEATKILFSGNPDEATVNPKYGKKFLTRLHGGITLTSNHKTGSLFLPPDDRRYDVLDCATLEEMGLSDEKTKQEYFDTLWHWFDYEGGKAHVYAFLLARDLSQFRPNSGQRKTAAHRAIVQESMANDSWLGDVLDRLGHPVLFRSDWALKMAMHDDPERKRSELVHRLQYAATRLGYNVLLSADGDGRWKKAGGGKCTLYLKVGTPLPSEVERRELLNKTELL